MVEMRWLTAPCGDWNAAGRTGMLSESERVIRVLQYRQETFLSGFEFLGGTWSDWKDVPTVTAQEPSHER